MAGFSTATPNLTRTDIWSNTLKATFEDELIATKYVNWLTDFPDGDTIHIPSIGQPEVNDYVEGTPAVYTAMDTGEYTFSVTEYKSVGTHISKKYMQDSYYADRLISQFVPKQHRALMKALEVDILAAGPNGQTASALNAINGADHRWVASGTNEVMEVEDFARALNSIQMANVPTTNLVAIVHPSVEYRINTLTNLANVSNNPRWEGIVSTGIATGMRFIKNIFGFDVYTSMNLKQSMSETIDGRSVTTGVANLFFSAAPGLQPFIGLIRQAPEVDQEFNKDYQRFEYLTTCRYGVDLYYPDNMVVVLSDTDQVG